MFKRLILCVALTLSVPLNAKEPMRTAQYFGFPGNDTCANWVENRKNNGGGVQLLEGWVFGFVTAYNFFGKGSGVAGSDTNAKSLLAWVDQYCATNPLETVVAASAKLVLELEKRQARP